VIIALALLLAGCRNQSAYLAGAIVLAISAGFRPQNLLIGFVPFVMASLFQMRRSIARVVVAIAALIAIVTISYLEAAYLTDGMTIVRPSTRIRRTSRASIRFFSDAPAAVARLRRFLRDAVSRTGDQRDHPGLCLIAIVRGRAHSLATIAAFGVFSVASWLMLDHFSASRFSIGYAPMIAILAAMDCNSHAPARADRSGRHRRIMIVWTWPALTVVRPSIAPRLRLSIGFAITWIERTLRSTCTRRWCRTHAGICPTSSCDSSKTRSRLRVGRRASLASFCART